MFIDQRAAWKAAIKNPEAYITKNRNRLKQNGTNVYLQNDDEFEIELFNPLQENVLAKIKLNSSLDTMDIVIRPGQRVFLERFLDQAKKFKFSTYEVYGDSPEVQNAIINNGAVIINFCKEKLKWTPNNSPFFNVGNTFNLTTSNGFNQLVSSTSMPFYAVDCLCSNTIETGIVDRGSKSNQQFQTVDLEFQDLYFHAVYWKILPASRKPIEAKELVVYCTECGVKRKKPSFKFCPMCGTKF